LSSPFPIFKLIVVIRVDTKINWWLIKSRSQICNWWWSSCIVCAFPFCVFMPALRLISSCNSLSIPHTWTVRTCLVFILFSSMTLRITMHFYFKFLMHLASRFLILIPDSHFQYKEETYIRKLDWFALICAERLAAWNMPYNNIIYES
jgi:hypothetical protein